MSGDAQHEELSRDEAHPLAREALVDAFFWDGADPTGPFGDDTGREILEALRDHLDGSPRASPIALLDELLERWEVANQDWDAVESDEVQALGEDDEFSLLTRDDAVLAMAFAHLVVQGRIDAELRRRAMLALARQALPALLLPWGDHAKRRAEHLDRMRAVLARRWD
jgi:uncharacterized protein YfeS